MKFDIVTERRINDAVDAHQEAFKSDPFAGARIRSRLVKGQELPHEVKKEADLILKRRRDAINKAFKAWKQAQEELLAEAA
jgi:hypothetical protein